MFVSIHLTRGIKSPFRYNERKLDAGQAVLILAANYLPDIGELSRAGRLKRLTDRLSLNPMVLANTLHISLNFHPEDRISPELFVRIAGIYLEKTGLGGQPSLVYRHLDAAHPHLHVVTVTVREDGSTMAAGKPLRRLSFRVSREIELRYGLREARISRQLPPGTLQVKEARRLEYGRTATFSGIAGIVSSMGRDYHFTSLPEFNAILRVYNVFAFPVRGKVPGQPPRGLVYQMLSPKGRRTGIPVAASSLPGQPTLDWLDTRFRENALTKPPHLARLRAVLDWVLIKPPDRFHDLTAKLEQEGVLTLIESAPSGSPAGFLFIDQHTRTVFRDTELGIRYTCNNLLAQCGLKAALLVPAEQLAGGGKAMREGQRIRLPEPCEEIPLRKPDQYPPLPQVLTLMQKNIRKAYLGPGRGYNG
ncbi:MAG TPA: relaxase/mobilization nuclease domain-containing protein [Chitinophagaceae bacterium]|nr:relaxase/mobilization nuclease domain-containing protein [Chitinophagaceae bacterium]